MGKSYRPYHPDQAFLLPPSLREWLPENHLVYFVSDVVDNLNLTALDAGRAPGWPFQKYTAEKPVPAAVSSPLAPPTRAVAVAVGRIEIELGDGSRVRVDDGVSLVTLRRVISALRG